MRTGILGLAIVLAAFAGAAHARPYKALCDQFEPLRRIADLKHVKSEIRVEPKAPIRLNDVVFTIAAKSGPIKVTPEANGTVRFPFTDKLCEENPDIQVNQAPGMVQLGLVIDPALPPVRTLDYKQLDVLRQEWDTAVSRQNLVWRTLAPSPKAFQVLFEPGKAASAEVRLAGGPRRFSVDDKGELRIPIEESWLGANPAIAFSELPRKIGLAFK